MRRVIIVLILTSLYLTVSAAPRFYDPETLKSSGVKIDVDYYGAPYVYDWDGDGKKDLVTGQFYYGNIRFYQNTGTHNNPSFSGFDYLEADGADIAVSYG